MKFRSRNASYIENCTFTECRDANGDPIDGFTIVWWCSCGHKTKQEHMAAPLPVNFAPIIAIPWYRRAWFRLERLLNKPEGSKP